MTGLGRRLDAQQRPDAVDRQSLHERLQRRVIEHLPRIGADVLRRQTDSRPLADALTIVRTRSRASTGSTKTERPIAAAANLERTASARAARIQSSGSPTRRTSVALTWRTSITTRGRRRRRPTTASRNQHPRGQRPTRGARDEPHIRRAPTSKYAQPRSGPPLPPPLKPPAGWATGSAHLDIQNLTGYHPQPPRHNRAPTAS